MDKELMEMLIDLDEKPVAKSEQKSNIGANEDFAADKRQNNTEVPNNEELGKTEEKSETDSDESESESSAITADEQKTDIADESLAEKKESDPNDTLSAILEKTDKIGLATAKYSLLLSEIKSSIESVNLSWNNTVEVLKRSLAANQTNENNIYKELETYKKNQYLMYIRPFLEFMISLLEDFKCSKEEYIKDKSKILSENSEALFNEIINFYDTYIELIQSQLEIQGVEIIKHQAGEKFNAVKQMISKTIATSDPALVGTVGEVESDCYMIDQKILKRAKVRVYKLQLESAQ